MNCALLMIDFQQGFDHPKWGTRSNPELVQKVSALLSWARTRNLTVIHVRHSSQESLSPLRAGQEGFSFYPWATPIGTELVLTKEVHSAFLGTGLEKILREQKIQSLLIAGLVAEHCVSTTTRMACDLGFSVTLLADATASFEKRFAGEHISAEWIQQTALASLHQEFATVITVAELLKK